MIKNYQYGPLEIKQLNTNNEKRKQTFNSVNYSWPTPKTCRK